MNSSIRTNATILSIFLFLSSLTSFSQEVRKSHYEDEAMFPYMVEFQYGSLVKDLPSILHDRFAWNVDNDLRSTGRLYRDAEGVTHERMQQMHAGIPVFGSTVAVHRLGNELQSFNGSLISALPSEANRTASITIQEAIQSAKDHIGADQYMWELEGNEAFIQREQNDSEASFAPVPELLYYPTSFPSLEGELRLAYEMDIYASHPISRHEVIVDALTGEVLAQFERIHEIDEPGTAETSYSGNQAITTYRPNTSAAYELRDLSRGGGIITYDCFDTDNYNGAQVPTNSVNDWDYSNITANAILDAHWGTEETYDYFSLEHLWNSYDNQNSPLRSYVHFSLIDYGYPNNNNAFWDGSRMTYGDGDGISYHPLTAIDVIAHEICHGVTEFSADLVYSYESGALNESFSDIFGTCVEYYAKPNDFSWLLGDDMSVNGSAIRSLSDPNSLGDPDTYQGAFWWTSSGDSGGVHTNSGVQNYWFYLLCEGGNGSNDNGDAYNVQAIGIEDAGKIAFRTLSVYLNTNSQYSDARTYSIIAATDLFGACSDQVIAVTNAWHAVGVGTAFNDAVVASFQPSGNYSCVAPATFVFTNNSSNSASFEWHFGDGTTSTIASPSHTYTQAGTYNVYLVANGSTQCNSVDTTYIATDIVVDNGSLPVVAACQPSGTSPGTNDGIFQFNFETIMSSSAGAQDGYQDFSCDFTASVTEGQIYPFEIQMGTFQYASLWLDVNNDGAFSTSEMVYSSETAQQFHSGEILVPGGTIFGPALRFRVLCNDAGPITNSCSVGGDGQVEDYGIKLIDNMDAPIADFSSASTTSVIGSPISIADLSLNVPTSWSWSFPGADVSASTDQNPSVTYSANGTYDVELIAANAHGADTLLIPDYISIVNQFNLCDITETQAPTGVFFDPGGPNGNYGNNDYCTLLIAPQCGQSVSLFFEDFSTFSTDYLRVYDGSDLTAPLMGTYSGTTIPSPITSSGGEIFILWDSNASSNADGFEIYWTSVVSSQDTLTTVASASTTNPAFGESIQFSDLSVETPSEWLWDFGDGTSSIEQNPSHEYLTSGPQVVTLWAANCVSNDTDTIYVDVQEPGGISLDPSSLSLTFPNCDDSIQTSIWITNTGAGDLNFSNAPGILTDDFEGAVPNPEIWSSTTGELNDNCGTNNGLAALWFNESSAREAVTHQFSLASEGEIGFFMHYGSGSGVCEDLDSGEHISIEYSTDNGANYTIIESYTIQSQFNDFSEVIVPVPAAAIGIPTRYRIRQANYSGSGTDNWSIDDFYIAGGSADVSMAPESGTITPGDSMLVDITVYRGTLTAGVHSTQLEILTNTSTAPSVIIPISMDIIGYGALSYSANCLAFDTIQEFTNTMDSVYLYNTGCADIQIESMTTSQTDMTFTLPNNVIVPNDSVVVYLSFSPTSFGDFTETLNISYDGLDTTLCLTGTALGAPVISTVPSSISLQLPNCEDSISGTFDILNSGNGPLDWEVLHQATDDFEGGLNNELWEEISGGEISSICGSVSGNNSLRFGTDFYRYAITNPSPVIAGDQIEFQLRYGDGGTCDIPESSDYLRLYYTNNGSNWTLINSYTPISDYYEFVHIVEVLPAGAIGPNTQFQWNQLGGSTIGTDIWMLDDVRLPVASSDITFNPETGTTGAGTQTQVDYTFYREGLSQGTYTDSILIVSNDPVNPDYYIPLDITISGVGSVNMPSSCLVFPEIQENTTATDSVWIYNDGCAPLVLSDFTTSSAEFIVTQGATVLEPNDSIYIGINYSPTLFGIHSASLDFLADGAAYTRCLEGTASGSSSISVSTDTIYMSGVDCPDLLESEITIYNTGNAPLNWVIGTALNDGFEDAGLNGNLWETSTGYNSDLCGVNSGSSAHHFDNSGTRYIQTHPLPVTVGTVFSFALTYGAGGSCEAVNSGEYVVAEYSLDGFSWVIFHTEINLTPFYGIWDTVQASVPAIAASTSTRIRIRQVSHSGSGLDVFSIDDVEFSIGSAPYLSFDPQSGLTPIGDSTVVTISVDASQLEVGTYSETVHVISDDPANPDLEIYVEFTVDGAPELSYSGTACHTMTSIYENTTVLDSIYIENIGCELLSLSNFNVNAPFSITSSPSTIETNGGAWFHVLFSPTSAGNFTEQIQINSDGGPLSICIEGEGLAAPVIQVSPPVIQVNFNECQEEVVAQLTINNVGGSDLNYTANSVYVDGELSIDTILSRWLEDYDMINSLVPNRFDFSNGESSYYISDGGSDMYDTGNRLRTENQFTIYYSNNLVQQSTAFGINGAYFTSKVPGMFLAVADLDDVDQFGVYGNLGQDGAGSYDISELTYSNGNESFTGYVKRHYGVSNPSVNHLIITETNSTIFRSHYDGSSYEDHTLDNMNDNDRVFYLLFASENGGYINDAEMQEIMDTFIDVMLAQDNFLVDITPEAGTVTAAGSETLDLTFINDNSPAGTYNSYVYINNNDPLAPEIEVPVIVNVPNIPCADFSWDYLNGCQGDVQFTNLTINDAGVWHWDFGDGTTSDLENPNHVYSDFGFYDVTLTSGSGLLSSSYTFEVYVQPVTASFLHTDPNTAAGQVDFASTSPTAVQWEWDFGDMTSAYISNPQHTYLDFGSYVVTLQVWDIDGCPGQTSDTLNYGVDGIVEFNAHQVELYPNPSTGQIILEHDILLKGVSLQVIDKSGRAVTDSVLLNPDQHRIDISDLANGIYFVELRHEEMLQRLRVTKQ